MHKSFQSNRIGSDVHQRQSQLVALDREHGSIRVETYMEIYWLGLAFQLELCKGLILTIYITISGVYQLGIQERSFNFQRGHQIRCIMVGGL
jgi:hypothetical protein